MQPKSGVRDTLACATAAIIDAPEFGDALAVAVTAKQEAGLLQLFQRLVIGMAALTLIKQFAIPVQTMGLELIQDAVRRAGDFSGRIYIFNAHQPLSVVMSSVEKTGKGTDQ